MVGDLDVVTVPEAVYDPQRLAAVRATGLLDTGPEDNFDRLTRLAAMLLDAPIALVTLVDDRRSFWKSAVGTIPAQVASERETPVEHSFCQHVVGSRDAVFIDDAELDPRTSANPLVQSLDVKAWAGFPVCSPAGDVLGSFCVVDHRPRRWSERDMEVMRTLSHSASGAIAVTLAAAGHPPALVRRAGGSVEEAGRHGTLLGILPRVRLHDVELLLAAGLDAAVARFSDGPPDDDIALLVLRVRDNAVPWEQG